MFHSAVLSGGELGEMPLNVIGAIATAGLIRSENVSAGIATYRSPTTTLLIPFHRVPPPRKESEKSCEKSSLGIEPSQGFWVRRRL
jgi:hypothetical protein